jgi:hypothetical protein
MNHLTHQAFCRVWQEDLIYKFDKPEGEMYTFIVVQGPTGGVMGRGVTKRLKIVTTRKGENGSQDPGQKPCISPKSLPVVGAMQQVWGHSHRIASRAQQRMGACIKFRNTYLFYQLQDELLLQHTQTPSSQRFSDCRIDQIYNIRKPIEDKNWFTHFVK